MELIYIDVPILVAMKKKILYIIGLFYLTMSVVHAQINTTDESATTPYQEIIKDQTPITSEELPPQVSGSFDERFPHTDHPVWYREGDNYSASFEREGKRLRSDFSTEGTWKGDYSSIEKNDLPKNVQIYLEEHLNDQNISQVYEVERETGRGYEIHLSDEEKTILAFDQQGNLVENR